MAVRKRNAYALLSRLFKFQFKQSHHALVPPLLLHSNLPPSDSERAAICSVVATVEEEIAELQSKPVSQQKRHRLSKCTELLRIHNAALSPIRWVPTEVLEQIFQHCTWQCTPGRTSHWRELPWAISQVCRTWREITLNLPFLWNRLPIHLGDGTAAHLDALATFLKAILARSLKAPLYLYMYAPFKEYDWHPLINVLAPHSKRVEELTIESSTITMRAFQVFKGGLPSLRKITLTKVSRRNHGSSALLIDLFEHAPLLREVTLVGLYTHELMLPWPQLISFNGNRINRTGLSQVVANSLELERLQLAGYSYGAGPKIVTLPRLTSLKVKLENPNITSNFFFGKLNLPKVEEIEVEQYQGELLTHLIPMLSRCPTPSVLRKLALRTALREAGNLTSLLRLTPQLVELDVKVPPLRDLSELIIDPESPPLVPMLETLIIHVNTEDVWRKEIPVNTLAHSRCEIDDTLVEPFQADEGRRKLKTFRLVFPNPISSHMAQVELNGWIEDPQPTGPDHFGLWRKMLHEELPELDYRPPPKKRKFDLKFAHRVDRLLAAIEDFQLSDVKGLYVSGLLMSLRRLSHIRPNHIPGDNIYHFRMRSQEILNNWAPSLRKDLVIFQWVMKGSRSLLYIPMNDGK